MLIPICMESICGDKAPPMAGGITPYIAGVFAMFAIENIVCCGGRGMRLWSTAFGCGKISALLLLLLMHLHFLHRLKLLAK
jgi:hypothetical protein